MLVMNSMLNNRFLDEISAWGGYEPLGYRWVLQKLNYHFKWWILVNLKYNLNFLDEWLKLDNQLHCLTSKAINQSYIKKRQILQTIEYRYTFYKKLGYEAFMVNYLVTRQSPILLESFSCSFRWLKPPNSKRVFISISILKLWKQALNIYHIGELDTQNSFKSLNY